MGFLWRMELFGRLRAVPEEASRHGAAPLTRFRSRKTGLLLAYLALYPQRVHRREALIDRFWPEDEPDAARHNLRNAISWLRRQLEPPGVPTAAVLQADRESIALNPAVVDSDVRAMDAALRQAERATLPSERGAALRQVVTISQAELLTGYDEEWVVQERGWRSELFFQSLDRLLGLLQEMGNLPAALEYACRGVAADPLREESHRELMRLYAATGQRDAALRQFRDLEALLRGELDAEPSVETRTLAEEIGRGVWPAAPCPAVRTEPARHNLPLPLTRLIGREAQATAVTALIGRKRLVTLIGPGGVGKTRLVLRVAEGLTDGFFHGVRLVDLAPVADAGLIASQIAAVLGVRESGPPQPALPTAATGAVGTHPGGPLLDALVDALRPREMLLLLDNCEHLAAGCARLTEALLSSCPGLKVLATSRTVLGVRGEQLYPVPPLSLPPETMPPSEALLASESVQLFAEQASLSLPDFRVTEENAAAIAAICRRLDGLPLAIELAAARVAALSPAQIAARLTDRLRLLTGSGGTAPTRHHSLAATLDWSHNLLAPPERALFRRLAVFTGGGTLAAIEAVCAGSGESHNVLDRLTTLVRSSLLEHQQVEGEARYRMLETVHEYARERLEEAGEADAVRAAHREWCLAWVARPDPGFSRWQEAMKREYGNLRAALAGAVERDEWDAALRLAVALGPLWRFGYQWIDGAAWLGRLLAVPEADVAPELRAQALTIAGKLAFYEGDAATARRCLEEGVAVLRARGMRRELIAPLRDLGVVLLNLLHDLPSATACGEELRSLCEEVGDRHGLLRAGEDLAAIRWVAGDYRRAHALRRAYLPLVRELLTSHTEGRCRWFWTPAFSAGLLGEFAEAIALMEESLRPPGNGAARRTVGPAPAATACHTAGFLARHEEWLTQVRRTWTGYTWKSELVAAGRLWFEHGAYEAARRYWEEALGLLHEVEGWNEALHVLNHLAHLARLQGRFDAAERYIGEGRRVAEARGHRRALADALREEGALASDRGDFAAACEPLEQSLSLCREIGHGWPTALGLGDLGVRALRAGDRDAARRLLDEAVALCDWMGRPQGNALALTQRAALHEVDGEVDAVRPLLLRALALRRHFAHRPGVAACLEGLAALPATGPARAARLLGAAEALRRSVGAAIPPPERPARDRRVVALRDSLGEAAFAAAWREGEAWSLEDAVRAAKEG
jgi:predicted ATPase/DNA-binding SARP family transcriptional activator